MCLLRYWVCDRLRVSVGLCLLLCVCPGKISALHVYATITLKTFAHRQKILLRLQLVVACSELSLVSLGCLSLCLSTKMPTTRIHSYKLRMLRLTWKHLWARSPLTRSRRTIRQELIINASLLSYDTKLAGIYWRRGTRSYRVGIGSKVSTTEGALR